MMPSEQFYILSSHFVQSQEISFKPSIELVGQKAIGLLNTSNLFTPPFAVISSELFKIWHEESQEKATGILRPILLKCINAFFDIGVKNFIVRSSAKFESFEERGYYKSSIGNISKEKLEETIYETWFENVKNIQKFPENRFAIIIQEYKKPGLNGHISNERRISRNKNNFLLEIVDDKGNVQSSTFSVNSSKIKSEIDFSNANSLMCSNKTEIINTIKLLSKYLSKDQNRRHIEWVWNNRNIWIVQNDIEIENTIDSQPGSKWKISTKIKGDKELISFSYLSNVKKSWAKIKCVKTFYECGLPKGEIYILEDPSIIFSLSIGVLNKQLEEDIEWLLQYPIVIRMDKLNSDGYSNLMLPRTETLTEKSSVIAFLFKYSKEFIEGGLTSDDFCFLLHRYINAQACALAFSKPQIPKVRIDSTWGIVDGLYYHPHDSFEVNLSDETVKKKIRCKTEFLDIDQNGKWHSIKAGTKWDWAESLTQNELIDIAKFNTTISKSLGKPVTVMYFVNVDSATGYPRILPWFYTTEEITNFGEKFTDIIFSETRELIQSEEDFQKLLLKYTGEEKIKFTIKLKLTVEILRYKNFIEKVGLYAKDKNIPIELEGSILSHTYYILKKIGARVKCIDPFNPVYGKQEFYKLVRDKIPVNIQSKGERTSTVNIDSHQLLNFLKEKAVEEVLEFFWESDKDKIIEEMADIFEVLRSTCKIFGIDIKEIEKIAEAKNENKGAFDNGLLLLDTTESSLIEIVDTDEKQNKKHTVSTKALKHKREKMKIHASSSDNSISLPYIIGGFESNLSSTGNIKFQVEFENRLVEIIYSNTGIKINFVRDKAVPNPAQLNLF